MIRYLFQARLTAMGPPVDHVHNNRLVRFCCKMCRRNFKKDPAKFIATLDAAVIEQQRKTYALETCVVSGSKLGSMGDPVEVVIANRLVRLCCGGCKGRLRGDPSKYLEMVDAAWKREGRPLEPQAGAP